MKVGKVVVAGKVEEARFKLGDEEGLRTLGRWHVREIGRFRLPARINFGPSGALTRTNVGLSAGVNARI